MKFTQNGVVMSLVGSTFGMTIKDTPEDSPDQTEAAQWQDINGDATGIITFSIGPLSAGVYWLDVKKWLTGATPSMRTTVIGPVQLKIIQSVTTRGTP
jgi:hypothetical protein